MLKVGFLGFGEAAAALTNWLKGKDVDLYTSILGRSIKTQNRVRKLDVKISESNQALAEECNILISAVTPAGAEEVAREVGSYVKGIYVDINNISPKTAANALDYIENGKTVDAAIMGGVINRDKKVLITASGPCAEEFAVLNNHGLDIKVLSRELGKAKTLKMLRSQYTKGVSALLFESLITAHNLGLENEFLKCLELTEGLEFKKKAISRIKSSVLHSKRRNEELNEIIEFQKNVNNSDEGFQEMLNAARDIFSQISEKSDEMEIPENYGDIMKLFTEKK